VEDNAHVHFNVTVTAVIKVVKKSVRKAIKQISGLIFEPRASKLQSSLATSREEVE
jgi:hypothetical protein